jgi:hypothetical protein
VSGALAAGCRRKEVPPPPVGTPGLALSRDKVALGSPVDITYRFEVAKDAPPFKEDYRVFVGVVDPDEELMWTDDHDPATPTTQWKPGQKIEYTRTVFVPVYPVGQASIHMGLYSAKTGKRVSLSGEDAGRWHISQGRSIASADRERIYGLQGRVARAEAAQDNSVEWQWTKKDAVLAFRNPRSTVCCKRMSTIRARPSDGQNIQVLLGNQSVANFVLSPTQRVLTKIPLTAAQLGAEEMVELRFLVDKSFVPALVAGSSNKDPRELGVRVFRLCRARNSKG